MKNRSLIIFLIILLSIIIISLIIFLVLCLTGKLNILSKLKNLGMKSTNIVLDEVYESKEISNIEISSNTGDITFKESMDEQIRVMVYSQSSDDVRVNINENVLKIDCEIKSSGWFNSYISDIIIYLPNDYFSEININSKYGDCEIIDLKNATLNITSNCGDIVIGEIKNATLNSDYGDIDVKTILNKCNIESNCGDIKIDNLEIKEDSTIKSDYGDVDIKSANNIYIEANVDFGDVKIENNDRHSEVTLKIEADCGDIKVGK